MTEKDLRAQCQIQKQIKVICPFCESIINVPMHKAVNGESIECDVCQRTFIFRKDD